MCVYSLHTLLTPLRSSLLFSARLPLLTLLHSSPLFSARLRSSPLFSTLAQIVTRVLRRLISKDKVLVRVDDNAQEDDDQVLMVHLNYAAQAD